MPYNTKEKRLAYNRSPERRALAAKYRSTPEYKLWHKEYDRNRIRPYTGKYKEYKIKYYYSNREKMLEYQHNHRVENLANYYKRRAKNPERMRRIQKNWQIKNREHTAKYVRDLRRSNPAFRLAGNLRNRLSGAIRNQDTRKSDSTMSLTGCTIQFLMGYLESQFREGMEWSNYGRVWEVDHIRPCASFDLTEKEQQRICFHYSNLQPLFASENRAKSDRFEFKTADTNQINAGVCGTLDI